MMQFPRKQRVNKRRWARAARLAAIALAAGLILASAPHLSWAQTPELPSLNLQASALTETDRQIATAEVQLDGRDLFAIAAPALDQSSEDRSTTPIQERVRGIETTLQRIADSDIDPQALEVTATIDESSNLPVVSINGQYLMTVTTLDAQLQVQEPDRWANRLTVIIRQALERAHAERQPAYLTRQSLWASGILLAILLISWVISGEQGRLRAKQKQLEGSIPSNATIAAEPNDDPEATAAALENQRLKRDRRNQNDVKKRLLQLAQSGLWGGGLFMLLGLFPYTRWLQSSLVSAPLKIAGIGLGVYLLVRISDLVIERSAGAFAEESLSDPEAYQRLNLRISTFSRVLRSVARVMWLVFGVLASLSVIGVDLVPLLAGAGLIGLAISFAAQSLIKDMINGILILYEDQYAVGDVIALGDVSGFVENMNLRITQLRDSEGQLITVPNSSITVVRNLSKDWSRVDLSIELAYGTDPDQALNVIRQLAQDLYRDPDWQSKMIDMPEVLGIDQMGHTGLLIRVWIKTLPLQQWSVGREFRRRLARVLEKEGLAIGVPQQSLYFRSALDLEPDHLDGKADLPSLHRP